MPSDDGVTIAEGEDGTVRISLDNTRLIKQAAATAVAWILPGVTAAMILSGEVSPAEIPQRMADFVIRTLNFWFISEFVLPLLGAVIGLFELVVETVLFVAFGQDRVMGGAPGLADGSILVADRLVAIIAPLVTTVIETVMGFNEMLGDVAAAGGLPAPIIVALLVTAELLGVLWAGWWLISTIDVPLVDVDDAISVGLRPFKAVLRRLT